MPANNFHSTFFTYFNIISILCYYALKLSFWLVALSLAVWICSNSFHCSVNAGNHYFCYKCVHSKDVMLSEADYSSSTLLPVPDCSPHLLLGSGGEGEAGWEVVTLVWASYILSSPVQSAQVRPTEELATKRKILNCCPCSGSSSQLQKPEESPLIF